MNFKICFWKPKKYFGPYCNRHDNILWLMLDYLDDIKLRNLRNHKSNWV